MTLVNRLVNLPLAGGAGQAWQKVGGVASTQVPQNSVSPRFCLDLGKGQTSRSQEGRATWSPEGGARQSMRGRCQSGSWENGGCDFHPKATPLSYWRLLSLPRSLRPGPDSWLLSRVLAPQGGATGSPGEGAIAFSQAYVVWRRVLYPRKMVFEVWESNSAQEFQHCPLSFLPRATNQSLLTGLQSALHSLCWSPEWVVVNEILCVGPLGGHLCL